MAYHRQSIRLEGYDYRQPGGYFITICVQNMECLLGDITNGTMVLNHAGQMIEKWWLKLKQKYDNIVLDEYIIMPNHMHGIIIIQNNSVGADPCVSPYTQGDHVAKKDEHMAGKDEYVADRDEHTVGRGEHMGSPLPTGVAGGCTFCMLIG